MNGKKKYIITSVICDVLATAVVLVAFCWFHHVERMSESSGDDGDGIIIGGIIGGNKDDDDIGDGNKDDETSKEPDSDTDKSDPDDTGDGTETEDETTDDETTEDPWPEYDLSGDFAANFPDKFLPEGEVEEGDGYYRSHDINLTVTEHIEDFGDYIARYIVYDVYVRNLENISTVASTKRVHFTELVKAAGDPIAAVSGDFWGNVACVAIRNGTVLESKKRLDRDICVLYGDGVLDTVTPSEYSSDYFEGKDVYQVWDFGPTLLDSKGKAYARDEFDDYYSAITGRNPRSSIGYYEPGHYVFIVADGRVQLKYNGESVHSNGLRMHDLGGIYEKLGVKVAYAFDGGDSAFAYYDGEVIRQDYDRANTPGEEPRKIYDIIVIGEVE